MSGESLVTGETPNLAGAGGGFGDGANGEHEDDDEGHDGGASKRVSRVVEHLDEGIAGGGGEDFSRVSECEADGHDYDE